MTDHERSHRRIVIKLGTSTLTAGTQRISAPVLVNLIRQIAVLRGQGIETALVSSGAIAAGRDRLSSPALPKDIPAKQMLAAIGQPHLMRMFDQLCEIYDLVSAQILLTRADLSIRRRYLNSRNTLLALLAQGVLPIINENDTVATEEIRVGDNDNLSALVAGLIDADLLILLTNQKGLYTADPRTDPAATLIAEIRDPEIPAALWEMAGGTSDGLGTGGMITKLQAAETARRAGVEVLIADGSEPDVLLRILAGEPLGTRFCPTQSKLESRKRFLLAGKNAAGKLTVDDGALQALVGGSSLLPVGVRKVTGRFERGDTVGVYDSRGREVARGIANYSTSELNRIRGKHTAEIEPILGYIYQEEAIHRDNMVLL